MDVKESKKKRFQRLASARTSAVLDKLRLLGNLSNRAVYQFSDKEVNKIFSTIEEQLRTVKARFKPVKKKFKL